MINCVRTLKMFLATPSIVYGLYPLEFEGTYI